MDVAVRQHVSGQVEGALAATGRAGTPQLGLFLKARWGSVPQDTGAHPRVYTHTHTVSLC